MKFLHVRTQGKSAFSFRLRIFDRYVDAGEAYDTEDDAAFNADVAKHFFREWYHLDLNRSTDPEDFVFECHRRDLNLSDRLNVEKVLPPGIRTFILDHRDALDSFESANRPEVKPWSAFRKHPQFYNNGELHEWVLKCEAAEGDVEDFSAVNSKSFFLRLSVVDQSISTALNSLEMAVRLHDGTVCVSNTRLAERLRLLTELQTHLKATAEHVEFLAAQFKTESDEVALALQTLESSRPPLV